VTRLQVGAAAYAMDVVPSLVLKLRHEHNQPH
jgi:hypothetical protein